MDRRINPGGVEPLTYSEDKSGGLAGLKLCFNPRIKSCTQEGCSF